MGKFQGILRMDLLGKTKAQINCGLGSVLFTSDQGMQVQIKGKSGKNLLKVVKAKQIVNGFRTGLLVYILKINKPRKVDEDQGPGWLKEYQDIFLEELTNLPP